MTSVLVIISRRVAANWRLMLALALGFVVSVGLMAATVIYAGALDDLGLDFALDQVSQQDLNLVATTATRLNPVQTEETIEALEDPLRIGPGRYATEVVRGIQSGTFYLTRAGEPIDLRDPERRRSYFVSRTGLAEHVTIEGRLPGPEASAETIEVAVGAPTAERLGVAIGDSFDLYPFWDEARAPVTATVVGILTRVEDTEGYWTGAPEVFDHRATSWSTYPFFVDETALVEGLGAAMVDVPGDISGIALVDRGRLTADSAGDARASFTGYIAYLEDRFAGARTTTVLPETIGAYEDRLVFSRIPLTVIIIQIVGIALYYLVMVASMLVERQAGEIALLKSRGATTAQVMRVYLVEGLALSLSALIIAPVLALLVVRVLGTTPIFSDLTGGSALEARLSVNAYLVAFAGALFATGALLVPAFMATRRTIVHYKQSSGRHEGSPVFFKYYLDLFFVGLLGLLFLRLRQEGAFASTRLGGLDVDPLVLVSPALFLVTAGVLFLRLFPLLLRGAGALLAKTRFTSVVIAMWHLVRNPTHYGRLVLMLVLATSLGTFAAGFGSTLNQNYGDRAAYEAGADVRVTGIRPGPQDPAVLTAPLESVPGIEAAAPVVREDGDYRIDTFRGLRVDIIGIDESIAETAFFRSDFAGDSLAIIAETLAADGYEAVLGPVVEEGDNWLSLWVQTGTGLGQVTFYIQIRDARGEVRDVVLDLPSNRGLPNNQRRLPNGWEQYTGPIPTGLESPVTVQGVTMSRPVLLGGDRGDILFDQVESFASTGPLPAGGTGYNAVTSFEEEGLWRVVAGQVRQPLADAVSLSTSGARDGATALRFTWSERLSSGIQRGATLERDQAALPVYASDSFLSESGRSIGDTVDLFTRGAFLRVTIVGSLSYFPTMLDPGQDMFMLVPMERYIDVVNSVPGVNGGVGPSELWLTIDQPVFSLDALRAA
ncbi:MAG: ABC transporter permease, partial [Tepidiformaceae bacterium]